MDKQECCPIEEVSKLLLDVFSQPKPPMLPDGCSDCEPLQELYKSLLSLRTFLSAAAKGDLSQPIAFKGYIAGTIKTLQANLRHMAWQTQMIASGDFSQRIDFMGEFSESFNSMVAQLDQTLKDLKDKEAELSRANKKLRKENEVRKRVEQALLKSKETLQKQSITDALTGLYNRMHFNAIVVSEVRRSSRYGRPLSAIMCDIDHFKSVNDTFGHLVGDEVIKAVAAVLLKHVRVIDMAARYGGEEFVLLLPETAASDAAVVAERIRKQVEAIALPINHEMISITLSFGISEYSGAGREALLETAVSHFIDEADHALYESKKAGRNRVTISKRTNPPSASS